MPDSAPAPAGPRLAMVYVETTRRCNLACPHCMARPTRGGAAGPELDLAELTRLVLAPARRLGARIVVFSGGEFFLRPDALEILAAADGLGFYSRVATNGLALDSGLLALLRRRFGSRLGFSLGVNSFDQANRATRCQDAGRTLALIKKLRRFRFNLQLTVTVGRHNAGSFPATARAIAGLGLAFNRSPLVPRGAGDPALMLDAATMARLVHPSLVARVHGYISFTPFFLRPEDYLALGGAARPGSNFASLPPVGCWCGSWLAVGAEGEVSPCPLLLDGVSLGNVRAAGGLDQVASASRLLARLRDRRNLGGRCGACRYRYTCGGCRALAYYQTGDVLGPDPTCFLDRLSSAEAARLERLTAANFRTHARALRLGRVFS
ncbi:MAG: radical SAM protein [Deltaproteobacteria bacterium]|nr:radical SAM protein [Deltaproteobacteria bacterium]